MPSEDGYRWTVHPARERPGAALAAVVLIFALSWCCYLVGQHEGWAILAVVVLCLSLARFFFPSHYLISDEEVVANVPLAAQRSLAWSEIKRVQMGTAGAWLSPYHKAGFREARRGVHLLFGRYAPEIRGKLQALAGDMLTEVGPDGKNTPQG